MGRYLTERLHNPGSNRALVFCTPYTPSHPGRRGRQQCGLSRLQPVVLRQQVPRGVNAVLVVGVVVAVGGEGGAERRLAELLARVRSMMIGAGRWGGVDEDQREQEEEVGGSVGGRDRGGVPGAGSELGGADDGDGRGPDSRSVDATLSRFGGGRGSLLLPPVNCRGPVDGDGLDRGGISRRVIGVT